MKKLIPILLLILLSNALVVRTQTPSLSLNQLIDSIEVMMEKNKIPGIMLTLIKGDSLLFADGLGYADLEDSVKVENFHLFRLGSITKSFTALSLIKLEREGLVDLDTPLRDVAPEINFDNPWEETDPVTIRHLLEHTSGFDDMQLSKMYNRDGKPMSSLDLVKNMEASLYVRWKPGIRQAYCNPGYLVAGYLVEKISGIPAKEYVHTNLFEPIGMHTTNLDNIMQDESLYTMAYQWKKKGYQSIPFRDVNAGMAGALNSNALDMAEFLMFYLMDGMVDSIQLFSPEELDYMETPTTTLCAKAGLKYGYGLANYTSYHKSKAVFHGHDGGIDGYTSAYGYNRQWGVGYAISNNGNTGLGDIRDLIVEFLTAGIPEPDIPQLPLDMGLANNYSGYYRFASPRNEVISFIDQLFGGVYLKLKQDTLYTKEFLKKPEKLMPTGDRQFRLEKNNFPTRILLTLDDGSQAMGSWGQLYEKEGFVGIMLIRIILFGSLVLLASLYPATLTWLVLAVLKKMPRKVFRRLLIPVAAALLFLGTALSLNAVFTDIYKNTVIAPAPVLFFLCSIFFGLMSLYTLWKAATNRNLIRSRALRIYYFAIGIGLSSLTVYMTLAGLIGMRFWII